MKILPLSSHDIPKAAPPSVLPPTVDERIYACIVLGTVLDWIKNVVRDLVDVCILQPMNDLVEAIQVCVTRILYGCAGGVHAPVGIRNQSNNCWAIATMQIIMNHPVLQQKILDNPDPRLELLRACIGQYRSDQEHGILHSQTIDSRHLRACFLNRSGSGVEDVDDAWNFILEHIPSPPPKYNIVEEPNSSFAESLFGFLGQSDPPQNDMLIYFNRPQRLNTPVNEEIAVFGDRYLCGSFIVHTGAHFAAYVKKGNTWWFCDDFIIRRAPPEEIQLKLQSSYIHYFSKVEATASVAQVA